MTSTCPPTKLGHEDNPYRKGNSLEQLVFWKNEGYVWVDQDAQESLDHTLWGMHWGWLYQDNFRVKAGGPLLKSGRRRVKSLPDRLLLEVKSPDGFKPHKYVALCATAASLGLCHEIELKCPASTVALIKLFKRVASLQKRYPNYHVRVKILLGVLNQQQIVRTFRRVKAAANVTGADVVTMLLNHHDKPVRLTKTDQAQIDLVRGKWVAV